MLAAQYSQNSEDVSVVQVRRVEKPEPAVGHMVVKVHFAAINPIDSLVLKGIAKNVFGWTMPLPFTMGYDFAGTVESVHESDAGFSIGDRVYGVNWGTHTHNDEGTPAGGAFAEYIFVPTGKVSKIPDEVSFEQAAAVALVGTTATKVLFDCIKLNAGQKVLILGGSTSVGQLAIQLAKERGAWVATTSSTRNLEYVSQFGADLVVNYNDTKWDELPALHGIDAVFDAVGEKDAFARATKNGVVKADGAFVSISSADAGFDPAGHPPLHFAAQYCLSNSVAVQDALVRKLASGALKITIDETFPFTTEGVHKLIKKVEGGASTGKNLLKIV